MWDGAVITYLYDMIKIIQCLSDMLWYLDTSDNCELIYVSRYHSHIFQLITEEVFITKGLCLIEAAK